MATAAPKKRKAKAPPPAGYVCKLCKQPGHWVYECAQCVKKPKVAKAPPKPNPCVSTEEARIKCHCGLRAMKRRSWKADQAAPEQRWVCARLKKHKIKRGDQNLKPCKFNVAVATAVPSSAPPAKKRVNTRYLQRDRRRKLKRKVFVSGMPFKAKAADFWLSSSRRRRGRAPVGRRKGGRKTGRPTRRLTDRGGRHGGGAAGSKLDGGRWLGIKRVAEKPPTKDATTGDGGDSSSSDDDIERLGLVVVVVFVRRPNVWLSRPGKAWTAAASSVSSEGRRQGASVTQFILLFRGGALATGEGGGAVVRLLPHLLVRAEDGVEHFLRRELLLRERVARADDLVALELLRALHLHQPVRDVEGLLALGELGLVGLRLALVGRDRRLVLRLAQALGHVAVERRRRALLRGGREAERQRREGEDLRCVLRSREGTRGALGWI